VIVLVHAGICDAGMWDGFDVPGAVRHEIRGFGDTPLPPSGSYSDADDLAATLSEPSALVGASFGGLVCLDVAARHPQLVSELVLLGAPLPDHEWSEEIVHFERREGELLEEGELYAAAALNADFWLADPSHRDRVIEMQQRAFELQLESEAEAVQPESIDLGAVKARTLVAVGDLDKPDFHRIAERLVREIEGAESAVIAGAGHLPSLERPEETARLVRALLHI
jgi:3-oxoadipate enol-lactonase